MPNHLQLIEQLCQSRDLPDDDLLTLISSGTAEADAALQLRAREVRERHFGNEIYLRGLVEFSNFCRNDCNYCGIRCGNRKVERYRLTDEQILECCATGYQLGFRTFVLQSGEDLAFTDERLVSLISALRGNYPDCAVTLSLGEKSRESYERYFTAGANRYLLRHETANAAHYGYLHPAAMSFTNRQRCLFELKSIGYQVGSGMMIGSPGQTPQCLLEDLRFMQKLQPHMIGIGPFIPHQDTPFAAAPAGTLHLTLRMLAILRLLFPQVLLPATTALGTIAPRGRELGILAGANVVMPNLTPSAARQKYFLYNNKLGVTDDAVLSHGKLLKQLESIGCRASLSRGDAPGMAPNSPR